MLLIDREHREAHRISISLLAVWIAFGCAETPTTTPQALRADVQSPQYSEEELFGNLYANGQRIATSSYYASLAPFDQVTANRLRNPQNSTIWADPHPGGSWMYGWYDPKRGRRLR